MNMFLEYVSILHSAGEKIDITISPKELPDALKELRKKHKTDNHIGRVTYALEGYLT
jgi:hypothetical protein